MFVDYAQFGFILLAILAFIASMNPPTETKPKAH
jgi:hypothetical protein